MSPLLMHLYSSNPTKSHLKRVNHNIPVATTSQTVMDRSAKKDPKPTNHLKESSIMRDFDCGFSLSDKRLQ